MYLAKNTSILRTADNVEEPPADSPYELQQRVVHPEFGAGVVSDLEADRLTVLFDDVGYRTLALALVEQERLLEPVAGLGG